MTELTAADLFAGAGGLSLGLGQAGWTVVLANEKSPDAAATYTHNLVGKWRGPDASMHDQLTDGFVQSDVADLLTCLTEIPRSRRPQVDLMAGGPPCQGFSLAGRRVHEDARNALPFRFLDAAALLKPKAILVENVPGFTSGFGPMTARPVDALRSLLAEAGYRSIAMEVEASAVGVAQVRRRVIILAVSKAARGSKELPEQASGLRPILWTDLPFVGRTVADPIPARAVLDDIIEVGYRYGPAASYPDHLGPSVELRFARPSPKEPLNHTFRAHSPLTRDRFRVLQAATRAGVTALYWPQLELIPRSELERLVQAAYPDGVQVTLECSRALTSSKGLVNTMLQMANNKHSQRVVDPDRPARTMMSLPDDHVHYAAPRTLTVREMARLQGFPDWFEFHGRVTTGGNRRRLDVPQYTQVGNAVPPAVGRMLGEAVRRLIG